MIIPARSLPFDSYSPEDLILIKSEVTRRLPTLKDLNIQQEIVDQYVAARSLAERSRDSSTVPANQKAQLQNTLTAILKQLEEMQERAHAPEQNRKREQALLKALQKHPELQNTYLNELEALLEQIE